MKIGGRKKEGRRRLPKLAQHIFERKVPSALYAGPEKEGGKLLRARLRTRLTMITIDEMGFMESNRRRSDVLCFSV